jgi:hypothetical protein
VGNSFNKCLHFYLLASLHTHFEGEGSLASWGSVGSDYLSSDSV